MQLMPLRPGLATEIAAFVMAAGWAGFAAILALGKRGAAKGSAQRDAKSTIGFLLQCVAYLLCFAFPRTYFSPLFPRLPAGALVFAALVIVLTLASVWFCFAAARALGKQWALMARVIEGHELIRQGPYAVVRNPIYLAMLGMLLATGFAVSRWQTIVCAVVVFVAGTMIRIRAEEKLLRNAFGAKFEDYARAVPAFLPLRWHRSS
jgi:protein-S-isoprenylcysteine O-methyltransferase Ste14